MGNRDGHDIVKKTADAYRVTGWSGGKTTELAIAPPEAIYGERSFLWRVSSATVELERSEFTPLPDYERLLMILDGTLRIRHDQGAWETLPAFQVHRFDGASDTVSEGRVIDFNLMLRKGSRQGTLIPISLRPGEKQRLSETGETLLIYCFRGQMKLEAEGEEPQALRDGESLLISGEALERSWIVMGETELRAVAAVVRNR